MAVELTAQLTAQLVVHIATHHDAVPQAEGNPQAHGTAAAAPAGSLVRDMHARLLWRCWEHVQRQQPGAGSKQLGSSDQGVPAEQQDEATGQQSSRAKQQASSSSSSSTAQGRRPALTLWRPRPRSATCCSCCAPTPPLLHAWRAFWKKAGLGRRKRWQGKSVRPTPQAVCHQGSTSSRPLPPSLPGWRRRSGGCSTCRSCWQQSRRRKRESSKSSAQCKSTCLLFPSLPSVLRSSGPGPLAAPAQHAGVNP